MIYYKDATDIEFSLLEGILPCSRLQQLIQLYTHVELRGVNFVKYTGRSDFVWSIYFAISP